MENTIRNKKLNKPPSVTIDYARQQLGERGQKMTDQQVSDLLNMLRLICNKTIDAVVEKSDSN